MKRKFVALALGIFATCSVAFSQVAVNETVNGNNIVGTVINVNPNTTLNVGTLITFMSNTGIFFNYHVTTVPSSNLPNSPFGLIANAINNAFNAANVSGALSGGVSPSTFGSNAGEYSVQFVLQQEIPFDFGITAVLGAGAIAAIKAGRRRRKEQAIA